MRRSGYNLIEVLIAMALLAWVVLMISGLFIYGQRGVYSGKTQTKAVALCQKVYEDLKNLPDYAQKYQVFGAASGNANKTTNYTFTTTNPFTSGDVLYTVIEGWKSALNDISATSSMTATLTPKMAADTSQALVIGNNIFIQYQIQINWSEGMRTRHVSVTFDI
jgi:prepilin-type N-terminal cleavage/methylation domain-containing protein